MEWASNKLESSYKELREIIDDECHKKLDYSTYSRMIDLLDKIVDTTRHLVKDVVKHNLYHKLHEKGILLSADNLHNPF